MTRPVVRPFTEEVYERLPAVYRDADPGTDWTLLRLLSLALDQVAPVAERADAMTPDEGLPALVDPAAADAAWLPWLAQLVGLSAGDADTDGLRARLVDREVAWRHGSVDLLRTLAREVAGPGADVVVTSEWAPPTMGSTDAGFGEPGGTFGDFGGRLRPGYEVPWTIAAWADGAGDGLTWAGLEDATGGVIGELDRFGTWAGLEGAPIAAALADEVPAGWRLVVPARRPAEPAVTALDVEVAQGMMGA